MRFTAAMVCLLTAISPSMVKGLSDGPACNCDACCDTTWSMQQDYPTGYYVAHTGSLKVLVVFARLKEDTLARGGNCWQYWNDSLPDFASDLVTPDTDPENFTEPSTRLRYTTRVIFPMAPLRGAIGQDEERKAITAPV